MRFRSGDRVRSTEHVLYGLPYTSFEDGILVPYGNGTVLRVADNGDCLVQFDASDEAMIVPSRILVRSDVLGPSRHRF